MLIPTGKRVLPRPIGTGGSHVLPLLVDTVVGMTTAPADPTTNVELLIASIALAVSILSFVISMLGVIASWYEKGQASITLHHERYPSVNPNMRDRSFRDSRLVIRNNGPGDAYNVELKVFGYGEDLTALTNEPRTFEWMPAGHSVHIPFFQPFSGPPLDTGVVIYSHGRFATNPAAVRQRGKKYDPGRSVGKLPRWLQRFHRNRRLAIQAPMTPHEIL